MGASANRKKGGGGQILSAHATKHYAAYTADKPGRAQRAENEPFYEPTSVLIARG